jgi:hypothetical protein
MLNEITVAVLGNFGVRNFWGPGSFPALWDSDDTAVQAGLMNLSQPPLGTVKLRWRYGDDIGQYNMLEYDYPDPPPGTHQYFVGLDPPGGSGVEIQADLNVGPVMPDGPDTMYWRLMATAGAFLGIWWADTREWHENPIPAPPTPTRQWTDFLLRAPSATWWTLTALYPGALPGDCPPIARPPWPYSSSTVRLTQLSMARRALKRRISGASQGSAQFLGGQAAINDARARYLAARQQQQN